MKTQRPVVAAIPNFNMAAQLGELLPQLVVQNYSDIFVLDDGSNDGSREVTEAVNNSVRFVHDSENRGAGAARNRIICALGYPAIIHFIDADMDLLTPDVPEVANDIMPTEPIGYIGGLIKTPAGHQSPWNYGARPSLRASLASAQQARIEAMLASGDTAKAARLRRKYESLLGDYPDPTSPPKRQQVFWAIEGSMLMDFNTFQYIGGFDESFREHDSLELAIRLHKAGLLRYFDPAIVAQHKEIDVRHTNRNLAKVKAELQIMRKFGLREWILPDGKFKADL